VATEANKAEAIEAFEANYVANKPGEADKAKANEADDADAN
jgi:hypothetical protein